jgi:hypothetical protein
VKKDKDETILVFAKRYIMMMMQNSLFPHLEAREAHSSNLYFQYDGATTHS